MGHRKHHEDLRRSMAKKEEEFRFFLEESRKKQEKIELLSQERETNLKEIKERDKKISDRESKIVELKKQNTELEKFQGVLDYKIKELRAQIDPKNDDIHAIRRVIASMDSDLEEYHRKNKLLQQDIGTLQSKQAALQQEILQQRKRLADSQSLCKRIKHDLYAVMEDTSSGKNLKKRFIDDLYKKYRTGAGSGKPEQDEASEKEIHAETQRQKEYLAKSVAALKSKVIRDSGVHRQDTLRAVQENMALIQNINDLRKQIAALKHEQ